MNGKSIHLLKKSISVSMKQAVNGHLEKEMGQEETTNGRSTR
jgi:hypothetical protein